MTHLRVASLAALFFFLNTMLAMAQDVTLTSRDGAVEISGDLLSYDGEFFRVDTEFGVLTLDGTGVNCSGPGCPDLESYVAVLRIAGAVELGGVLLPRLIEGFADAQGYKPLRRVTDDRNFTYVLRNLRGDATVAEFNFSLSTTQSGFEALIGGEADIALATREASESVIARAIDAGQGDLTRQAGSRVIALDGLVPVISTDNPVRALSVSDIARVISGEVDNWAALGGFDAPVSIHLPQPGTGLADMVLSFDASNGDAWMHPNSAVLTDAVARDPFALGLARMSDTGSAQVVPLAGDCGFDIAATRAAVKAGDYPLTRPQFLYLPARRLPKTARDFLRFLGSDAAQQIVRQAGFTDQQVEEIAMSAQGDRIANAVAQAGEEVSLNDLQEMVNDLRSARRLTLTFRFETGSSTPDAQSRENVAHIASLLEAGRYDGQELIFVGFSDGEGGADANRQIALRRAVAVLNAVKEAAPTLDGQAMTLTAKAFGEAMPLACDETEWGRRANRRVELWIRPQQSGQR